VRPLNVLPVEETWKHPGLSDPVDVVLGYATALIGEQQGILSRHVPASMPACVYHQLLFGLLADTRVLLMPHLAVGRNVSTEAIEKHGLGLVPVSFNHCSDQRLNYLTCTDSEK